MVSLSHGLLCFENTYILGARRTDRYAFDEVHCSDIYGLFVAGGM